MRVVRLKAVSQTVVLAVCCCLATPWVVIAGAPTGISASSESAIVFSEPTRGNKVPPLTGLIEINLDRSAGSVPGADPRMACLFEAFSNLEAVRNLRLNFAAFALDSGGAQRTITLENTRTNRFGRRLIEARLPAEFATIRVKHGVDFGGKSITSVFSRCVVFVPAPCTETPTSACLLDTILFSVNLDPGDGSPVIEGQASSGQNGSAEFTFPLGKVRVSARNDCERSGVYTFKTKVDPAIEALHGVELGGRAINVNEGRPRIDRRLGSTFTWASCP